MNDGQNNIWSSDSVGKNSLRKIVVNALIEEDGTNTFFSYQQLATPLDEHFRTKYAKNKDPLATIDEAVVKQAFREGGRGVSITRDSYSQASVDTKEVRKVIAHILWEASFNKPEV